MKAKLRTVIGADIGIYQVMFELFVEVLADPNVLEHAL